MAYTFAIGDVHGCSEQLESLLENLETMWPGGTVVFLGDYIDRGPDSRGVIERLMAGPTRPGWRWISLKGNHEELMVSTSRILHNPTMWLSNGGEQTLESFGGNVPDVVIDWADALPIIHRDTRRIFVHAGVDEALPLEAQEARTLLWHRPLPNETGNYWGRHLVHGHTPTDDNPVTFGNRTNIDSGCVFGGSLTAAVFDDDVAGGPLRFVSIQCSKRHW